MSIFRDLIDAEYYIEYQSSLEYQASLADRYIEAKEAWSINDLAKHILDNQDKITKVYRQMNLDIANKVIKGYNITDKQKNCLYNCYAFMEE
jgi:tryptophan 2,3-dioxygenase